MLPIDNIFHFIDEDNESLRVDLTQTVRTKILKRDSRACAPNSYALLPIMNSTALTNYFKKMYPWSIPLYLLKLLEYVILDYNCIILNIDTFNTLQ